MLMESNYKMKTDFNFKDQASLYQKQAIPYILESKKKCLVLDLDETLVHHFTEEIPHPDLILQVLSENDAGNKEISQILYVLIRPFVQYFLKNMHYFFNLIIYTAGNMVYADNVINFIDKDHLISKRYYTSDCAIVKGKNVKDLRKIGINLKDIIIIDNSSEAFQLQPENGIQIKSWYDDLEDKELYNLIPLLEQLSQVDDVRIFLHNHRIQRYQINFKQNRTDKINAISYEDPEDFSNEKHLIEEGKISGPKFFNNTKFVDYFSINSNFNKKQMHSHNNQFPSTRLAKMPEHSQKSINRMQNVERNYKSEKDLGKSEEPKFIRRLKNENNALRVSKKNIFSYPKNEELLEMEFINKIPAFISKGHK